MSRLDELRRKVLRETKTQKKSAEEKPKGNASAEYFSFFEKNFPNTKKCLLRNVAMSKDIDPDRGFIPIKNYRDEIESMALDEGLSSAHVKKHLARWCLKKERELLVDIPEWDGRDHIGEALDRMYVTNIEHKYFIELFKEWFANIILRIYNSEHQNRCIILRGKQGIGKDYAIKKMLSGFGQYANEIQFGKDKIEVYRVIRGLAVGVIPEFDETNKTAISVIKSVITASSSEMRALYQNDPESIELHTSFISASNFRSILRDTTGNRRFMIFTIDNMEHSFDQVSGPQIAAQAFKLAADKFKASAEAQVAMREIIERETPPDPEELFLTDIFNLVSEMESGKNAAVELEYRVTWDDIKERFYRIADMHHIGKGRARSLLKSDNLRRRDAKGVFFSVK